MNSIDSRTLRQCVAIAMLSAGSSLLPFEVEAQEQGVGARLLEEVIVTARRREETAQDVPLAISAYTSDEMQVRGIDRMEDLNILMPNLSLAGGGATGEGRSSFVLRGIPGVATYIDGVWLASTSGLLVMNLVDMERVELLRGPQGTLFGKDAIGGAINYVTALPGDEFSGRFSATMGDYDRRDISLAVDIPITDNLSTRWTAASMQRDGFIESIAIEQWYGDINDSIVRGDIMWTPSDRVTVRFTADLTDAERDGHARITYDLNEDAPKAVAYTQAGYEFTRRTQRAGHPGGEVGEWQNRSTQTVPGLIFDVERYTMHVDWDISDTLTFRSITSTQDLYSKTYTDFDASEITMLEDDRRQQHEQVTQEFQLLGENGRVSWVAGAYYWDEEDLLRQFRYSLPRFFSGEFSVPGFNPSPPPRDRLTGDTTYGWAVFGEANIEITDQLSATLGIRQTEESFESWTAEPSEPVAREDLIPNVDPHVDLFSGVEGPHSKADFSSTTPRASLQYEWTPNVMGYVSYAEGFDRGGVQQNDVLGLVPFDPQKLKNYEIGLKSDLLNNRLRLNISAFSGTWDGIHLTVSPPDPNIPGGFLPAPYTANVGEAKSDGLEIETIFVPGDNWRFDANFGWLDARYTEVAQPDEAGISTGSRFAQAPEFSYSLGAQYDTMLANGGQLTLRMDYGWQDEYRLTREDDRALTHPDYGLVHARINYQPADANWRLSVFGSNLTDERYVNSGFSTRSTGLSVSTVGRPREYGATLQFFFE